MSYFILLYRLLEIVCHWPSLCNTIATLGWVRPLELARRVFVVVVHCGSGSSMRYQTFYRLFPAIFAASVIAFFAGCTSANSGAKSVQLSSTLTLTGKITDLSSLPVQNAQVFLGYTSSDVQAQTGKDGAFSITLAEADLNQAVAANGESVQRLFIATLKSAPTRLIGLSAPIDLRLRGNKDIGEIKLGVPASLKGTLMSQDLGQRSKPVADGSIKVGRAQVQTLADGTFELNDLPAGDLIASASANNLQTAIVDVKIMAGQTTTLDRPIVLFPGNAVAGIVQPLPVIDLHELAQAGHPYQRSFEIHKSSRAKLIRYSHTEDLVRNGDTLAWKEIRDVMDYDFPSAGGHRLYVQFAESADGEKSEIYHVTFVVNAFSESRGFTIEDGRGIIRRRNVTVNIDVPANAWRMRLSSKEDDLSHAIALAPSPVVQYTFPQIFGSTGLESNGFYDLFLQFEDAQGQKSEVYRGSVYLEVFPRANDVFKINDGAPSTPYRTVKLSINVPTAARKMRVFEVSSSSGGGGYSGGSSSATPYSLLLETAPEIYFTLSETGTRTVYLQFLDAEGAASPVYHQLINVDVEGGAGFNIVGGGFSLTKTLQLELLAPPHVSSFKVYGHAGESFSAPWQPIAPFTDYVASSWGMNTIYVEFRSADGDSLDTHSRTVFIDPFPSSSYGFTFAPGTLEVLPDALFGSQLLSRSQILTLLLTPSPAATEFAVQEGSGMDWRFTEAWRPLAAGPNGLPLPTALDMSLSSSTGLKAISVRFRTAEGEMSPVLTKLVYFDPFFAPPTRVSINGGAATTTTPEITLTYFLGAIPSSQPLYVRQATNPMSLDSEAWLPLTTSTSPYTLPGGTGLHTIYVQFKLGETESSIFSDSIEVVP